MALKKKSYQLKKFKQKIMENCYEITFRYNAYRNQIEISQQNL